MKNSLLIFLVLFIVILISICGCKKLKPPTFPAAALATSTPNIAATMQAQATQTAIYLETAGISAQQSATAQAQQTATTQAQATQTAIYLETAGFSAQQSATAQAQQTTTAQAQQTLTAQAQETATVQVQQTATAQAQQTLTAQAQQTLTAQAQQTEIAQAQQTLTAQVQQTATAQAQQTAIAMAQETATAQAQETVTAQAQQTAQAQVQATAQAQATQTAAALQTAGLSAQETATAEAAATATAVEQMATLVAAAQKTADAELTATAIAIATFGTATYTPNATETAAAQIATAEAAITLTYLATAGQTAQVAATETATAANANATATAAAVNTAEAMRTVVTISPSNTPTINLTPSLTPTLTLTPTAGIPPAPYTIYAYVSFYDFDSYGTNVYGTVYMYDANYNTVQKVSATLKDITKASQVSLTNNGSGYCYAYYYDANPSGDTFEVDVYFNGVTYTSQAAMPAIPQLSADGNTVSWQSGITSGNVYVDDPAGNQTLGQSISGTSMDISSAYTPGVYGEYYVGVNLSNAGTFTGGASASSSFSVKHNTAWDVDVTSGSITVMPTSTPAPTVTGITIEAIIMENDLEGGLSAQDMVYIMDASYNPITDAGVIIKDLTKSSQTTVYYNATNNYYQVIGADYTAGDTYEVDVCVSGITYTAQASAPSIASGNLSTDANTVSWTSNGNYNEVDVDDSSGNQLFYQTNLPGNSVDISSYDAAVGDYSVNLWLGNAYSNNSSFSGLAYDSAVFAGVGMGVIGIIYEASWDVSVTY